MSDPSVVLRKSMVLLKVFTPVFNLSIMKKPVQLCWLSRRSSLNLYGSEVSSQCSDKPIEQKLKPQSLTLHRFYRRLALIVALTAGSLCVHGQSITGKVFFDGNNNGAFESGNEVGFGALPLRPTMQQIRP